MCNSGSCIPLDIFFFFFKEQQKKVRVPWDPAWHEMQQVSSVLLYRAQKLCAVEYTDVSATVCGREKSLVNMLEREVREQFTVGFLLE